GRSNLCPGNRNLPAKTILEPARDVPLYGEYEVAVLGGGAAGIAAAAASGLQIGGPGCGLRPAAPRGYGPGFRRGDTFYALPRSSRNRSSFCCTGRSEKENSTESTSDSWVTQCQLGTTKRSRGPHSKVWSPILVRPLPSIAANTVASV